MLPNKLIKNEKFLQFAERLMEDPPYIIMVHLPSIMKTANSVQFEAADFEMVKNHICNLKYFPGGYKRLAAVALDSEAEAKLLQYAPEVPVVALHVAQVDLEKESTLFQDESPSSTPYRGILVKQLVYILRARISQTLSLLGVKFWMMQQVRTLCTTKISLQDTIWTENFAEMLIEDKYSNYELLFDTVGNEYFYDFHTFGMNWFCGASFFVRGTPTSANFFQNVHFFFFYSNLRPQVELMLLAKPWYPDSAIMTFLCARSDFKCGVLPRKQLNFPNFTFFRTVSCSSYFETNNTESPALLQMDVMGAEPKISLLKKNNMAFVEEDGKCNFEAVKNLK